MLDRITAAGICVDKPFLEHDWEDVHKLQAVNVCISSATSLAMLTIESGDRHILYGAKCREEHEAA